MIRKAVILAGGKGTRMLPYTKACPKEMLPLGDKPALHYVVQEAVDAGISEILIIISPDKEVIKKYFQYDEALERDLANAGKSQALDEVRALTAAADINFAVQYVADGTGGAILLAEEFAGGDAFLVMNGDDIMTGGVSAQIINAYGRRKLAVLAVSEVDEAEISNCGSVRVVKADNCEFDIDAVIEKPRPGEAFGRLATQGRYVLPSEIFDYLKSAEKIKGELRLTDAINLLAHDKGAIAWKFDGIRYDLGSKEGYAEAAVEFMMTDEVIKNKLIKIFEKYRG